MAPKVEIQSLDHDAAMKQPDEPLTSSARVESEEDLSTSDDSAISPSSSSVNSKEDAPPKSIPQDEPKNGDPEVLGHPKKVESLQERGRIPGSFYVTVILTLMAQGCSGMYKLDTLKSWWRSMTSAIATVYDMLEYEKDLMQSLFSGEYRDPMEYVRATLVTLLVGSILWVLVGKPLSAGLWTGQRASTHKFHRYMGLAFLIQYALAWVDFLSNGELSYIPHTTALNGIIQGYSAYFSFKVLPALKDAGFYSDKGVLSRNFVHENICFNWFCVWGSIYYRNDCRAILQSNLGGKIMEYIMCFFPYVAVRPWFPTTRFSDAGTRNRSPEYQGFYKYATLMVKIFYLWAKYFLGFQINWLIFLGKTTPDNMRFIQGLHLLNTGTVAIAVFLHTLRFRKILPPRFAFSIYVGQIYLTFTALPYAIDTVVSHPKLSVLSFSGLLCNMTRSLKVHTAWCFVAMALVAYSDIDW